MNKLSYSERFTINSEAVATWTAEGGAPTPSPLKQSSHQSQIDDSKLKKDHASPHASRPMEEKSPEIISEETKK